MDQDKFQELVKEHLDSVSRLRGERDASRMAHREKILAQLDQRKRQGATRTKVWKYDSKVMLFQIVSFSGVRDCNPIPINGLSSVQTFI